MDALENIMTRRSVRRFLDKPVSDRDLETILRAGMAGPSCVNARDWHFIVVRDREVLARMAAANGRPADPLKRAAVGILICGDLERAFKPAPDYWIIDGAIAGQNMCLAAYSLGIGSVWLGTYPQMERVKGQIDLFGLPDTAVPHSILAFGWPDESKEEPPGGPGEGPGVPGEGPGGPAKAPGRPEGPPPQMKKGEYEESRLHWDKW